MKKLILVLIVALTFMVKVNAIEIPNINSKYAYIYNLTEDKVMYEKDEGEEIKVASMTKIMTAIIVIEKNKDLDKVITVKDEDLRDMYEYTTTGFQNGDQVTIRDLLYGILLKSGSDAVNAAVRITTNTEEEFITLMNNKAKELGLTHTHFSNPIGKDEDNYSSVEDMSKIMEYCLKNKDFKDIVSTDKYIVDTLDLQISGPLYNSIQKYKVDTSIVSGCKTGFTSLARHSITSYSEKDGITYLITLAYADTYTALLQDVTSLYNYLFDNYGYKDYEVSLNLNIKNGKEKTYIENIKTKLFLKNDYNKDLITYEYSGRDELNFLINKGDKLGNIKFYYDNELIKTQDVKLQDNIKYKPKAYFGVIMFTILFIIILLLFIFRLFHRKKSVVLKERVKNPTKNLKKKKKHKNKKLENKVNTFIKKESSINNKLNILNTTYDVNLFFNTLKSVNITIEEKKKLEHAFIDRCFESINFKNSEELEELYTKLKLYRRDMERSTITYYNKLFKYCIDEYIEKK